MKLVVSWIQKRFLVRNETNKNGNETKRMLPWTYKFRKKKLPHVVGVRVQVTSSPLVNFCSHEYGGSVELVSGLGQYKWQRPVSDLSDISAAVATGSVG